MGREARILGGRRSFGNRPPRHRDRMEESELAHGRGSICILSVLRASIVANCAKRSQFAAGEIGVNCRPEQGLW